MADYDVSEFATLRIAANFSLAAAADYLELTSEQVLDLERGGKVPAAIKQVLSIAAKYPDDRIEAPKPSSFRFIDLFAGIGGIRLPFSQLGGECVFSSEWDRFAQKTYERNFGEVPHGDITAIKSDGIPDHDLLLDCVLVTSRQRKQGCSAQ